MRFVGFWAIGLAAVVAARVACPRVCSGDVSARSRLIEADAVVERWAVTVSNFDDRDAVRLLDVVGTCACVRLDSEPPPTLSSGDVWTGTARVVLAERAPGSRPSLVLRTDSEGQSVLVVPLHAMVSE